MSKATLAVFSIAVVFLSCPASFAGPTSDDCRATEITLNSHVIRGDVILVNNGRERSAGRVEADAFEFKDGEWLSLGTIVGGGGFGWLAEKIGKYKFVVRREGFQSATLIATVSKLKSQWRVITVPLKAAGRAYARLGKRG